MAGDEDEGESPVPTESEPSPDRRRALKYGALAGLVGVLGVGAAMQILGDGSGSDGVPPATETEPRRSPRLARTACPRSSSASRRT
jgi:hypothetical protein